MPILYIHYGIGSVEFDRGNITTALSVPAGSTVNYGVTPKPGWKLSSAQIGLVNPTPANNPLVMGNTDTNVYLNFTEITSSSPTTPSPPNTPPVSYPPASGESIAGSVGTRCDIMQMTALGSTLFAYRDRYTNFHSNWDASFSKTQALAQGNSTCFLPIPSAPAPAPTPTPTPAPTPELPVAPILNPIKGWIDNLVSSFESQILGTVRDINTTTVATRNSLGNISSQVQGIMGQMGGLSEILSWTRNFRLPDWNTVIVQPVLNALGPLAAVKNFVDNFRWPDWHAVIVQPVLTALAPLAAVKKFVDDFKFPDWNAVIVQPVTNAVDVWFSNRLGINPKLPFWTEIETKIAGIVTNIILNFINTIIPEPPKK